MESKDRPDIPNKVATAGGIRSVSMDDLLNSEMLRLESFIVKFYYQKRLLPRSLMRPGVRVEGLSSRLDIQKQLFPRFEMQDNEDLRRAVRNSIPIPAIFNEAIAIMNPRFVIIFTLLIWIRRFELAKVLADIILRSSPSPESRQRGAQTLTAILRQVMDNVLFTMDERFEDDGRVDIVEDMLLDVGNTGCVSGLSPTIDTTFDDGDWDTMERLYEEQKNQPLSKKQLDKVILMAAWNKQWAVFLDCAQRGAELIRNIKGRGADTTPDSRPVDVLTSRSPLHEALRNGDLKLTELEAWFPDDLVNAVDQDGSSLLHLAIDNVTNEARVDIVKFLMKHKADVNIRDNNGKTMIEYLVGKGHRLDYGDALVALVMGADSISPHCWQVTNTWSAVHVLCHLGLHQYILPFVEKGANQFELRDKLTVIDTLVLQENMRITVKEQTMAVLLDPSLRLGPFHAKVISERLLNNKHVKKYGPLTEMARRHYLSPVERLLYPVLFTRKLIECNLKLVQMLVDAGAVCDQELMALEPRLATLKEDGRLETEQYLRTQIDNIKTRSDHPQICELMKKVETAEKP